MYFLQHYFNGQNVFLVKWVLLVLAGSDSWTLLSLMVLVLSLGDVFPYAAVLKINGYNKKGPFHTCLWAQCAKQLGLTGPLLVAWQRGVGSATQGLWKLPFIPHCSR